MNTAVLFRSKPLLAVATLGFIVACADEAPLSPERVSAVQPQLSIGAAESEVTDAVGELRRATGRYHNLDLAIADGFVHLHDCEVREEGPVGVVYVHPGRINDVIIDPSLPEALIYEPGKNGRLALAGVELVVPYALWSSEQPPQFLGNAFQSEDEFAVFGLHVWVWHDNPNGLFAETNPDISCAQL
jgi:hypothetical protein